MKVQSIVIIAEVERDNVRLILVGHGEMTDRRFV
jgi:hypothetical protein